MAKFEKVGEGRWTPVEDHLTVRFFVLTWAAVLVAYGVMAWRG